MRLFPWLAVALASLSTDVVAGFHFRPYVVYADSATSRPGAVVIGDVTGDGRDDAIIGSSSFTDEGGAPCTLFIYVQQSNGTLAAPVKRQYRATDDCNDVRMEIADLDNDGIKDIVVGRDHGVTVLLARGQLSFRSSEVDNLPGDYLVSMTTGDLNEDGNNDLAWQAQDRTLNILLGDGKGGLRWIRSLAGVPSIGTALRIGDVTGDRRPDLILADLPDLVVYPGNGDGSFAQPRTYASGDSTRSHHNSLAISDVNFDGRNDIVAAISSNYPRGGLLIYEGAKDGALSPPLHWSFPELWEIPEGLIAKDLDFNGYPDFLVAHGGYEMVSFHLQGPAGFTSHFRRVPRASHYDYDRVAAGDLDGDGCTDVALADYHNGMVVLLGYDCYEPPRTAVHHEGDFDGDGKSDILWHNAATGTSVIWRSGDKSTQVPMARLVDKRWFIAGIGDFNGDGKSDVLWRHPVTGANAIWNSGDHRQFRTVSGVTDTRWKVDGIGDFDGDGSSDILWHHPYTGASATWGSALRSRTRTLTTITDTAWKVAGIGDFDGNGRSDILWRHAGDGRNAIWRDGDYGNQLAVDSVTDTGWQAAGLGDFDNDGRTDIFWRHAFNGRNAIWHGGSGASRVTINGVTDLSWKLVGVGDYMNDGRSDLLWRNRRSGINALWRNADPRSWQPLARVTSMNWHPVR